MREIHHFIDGQTKTAGTGRFHNVYDPSTGKVQALVELASAEFLAEAVAGAKK
ncbi:MAG: methylmalonate-semialdehyde dehydrogenase (CoA acylating), partial [Aquidulcibacter sp.]|nr:methylmalonate-semialdehyde dehydrogenase (CoA acylating) [Aquidulcibacter sp.]